MTLMQPPDCLHDAATREAAMQDAARLTAGHGTGMPPGVAGSGAPGSVAAGSIAAASDSADGGARAHLASCAACRETYDVTLWMTRLAVEGEQMAAERDLPDPARIWWRARLLQRWEAETRATAPLDVMQRVEILGGLIAAVVLLLTLWPELRGFGDASSAASAAGWWPVVARLVAPSGLTTLIIVGSLLIGAMAAFTVHQLMVED